MTEKIKFSEWLKKRKERKEGLFSNNKVTTIIIIVIGIALLLYAIYFFYYSKEETIESSPSLPQSQLDLESQLEALNDEELTLLIGEM